MIPRCEYCKKPIRAGKAISAPGGLLFDSFRCRDRHLRKMRFEALRNTVRVARSRLKVRAISRAGALYRGLGGRDWPEVEELLRALL